MSGVLLDSDGIGRLIPHAGRMCLLHALIAWDDTHIHCRTTSHTDPLNPLRGTLGLLASAGIEYGAQAMALHGGLLAQAAGHTATPGFLASARGVQIHHLRLDELDGTLDVRAERQAGDEHQLLYRFVLEHAGRPIVEGRAAVVLNTALT